LTDGLFVQNDAKISHSRFDLENKCSNMNYLSLNLKCYVGRRGHDLQLYIQSVPIYTKFVGYNHAPGEVYSCTRVLDTTLCDKVCQ